MLATAKNDRHHYFCIFASVAKMQKAMLVTEISTAVLSPTGTAKSIF